MLAVILASTVAWPVLVYSGFFRGNPALLYVNVIGKWIYLVAALITVIGLCVMAVRVIKILYDRHINDLKYLRSRVGSGGRTADVPWSLETARRVWQAASLAVIAVTLVAIVPSLITQSQVGNPHARGLGPPDLVFYSFPPPSLYRALPQLLNWLLLVLAVAVLLSISRAGDDPMEVRRIAARRIAIPVMMLILFSAYSYYYAPWILNNYAWLYLPITPVVGLMILAWLVLPTKLTKANRTRAPKRAIQLTLDAWRRADFA